MTPLSVSYTLRAVVLCTFVGRYIRSSAGERPSAEQNSKKGALTQYLRLQLELCRR